jgi:hypothetical protein
MAIHIASTCTPNPSDPAVQSFHKKLEEFVRLPLHSVHSCAPLDREFSVWQVKFIIKSGLRLRTALGPDGISPFFLANAPDSAVKALTLLFNFSWRHGVLPLEWKRANIFTLHKGDGSRNDPNNYRPISLTSVVVKLMERLILRRLWKFSIDRNIILPSQAGFRAQHNTHDQLFRIREAIQRAFRYHKHLSVAFLDITKAYDKTWQAGLLYKLHAAGVHGRAWRWIRAFLHQRQFRVIHGNSASEWFPLSAGVPQGSVISPWLFLMFINDFPTDNAFQAALFADDIAMWGSRAGLLGDRSLQKALHRVHGWSVEWRVAFSSSKSNIVCFHNSHQSPSPQSFSLGSLTLERKPSYKYLGLQLHERGGWHLHFQHVLRKIARSSYLISRIIHPSDPPTMRTIRALVQATIIPQFSYGFPFWHPPSEQDWRRLTSVTAMPLRVGLGLPFATCSRSVLAECGLPDPRVRWEASALAFATRTSSLPDSHLARELFDQLYNKSFHHSARRWLPLSESVKQIEESWGVSHRSPDLSRSRIKQMCLSRSLASLSDRFRSLHPDPGPAMYLRVDAKPIAAIRARLRFDRARLNHSLCRRGLSHSSHCPHCPDQPETVEHLLMSCPRYAAERERCRTHLLPAGVPFLLNVILGDVEHLARSVHIYVLEHTGIYLQTLQSLRRF